MTFTATVSVNSPGAGTPTGSVDFFDGSNMIGAGTLSGGTATFSTNTLTVGSHAITAAYLGDGNFSVSSSPGVALGDSGPGGPRGLLPWGSHGSVRALSGIRLFIS